MPHLKSHQIFIDDVIVIDESSPYHRQSVQIQIVDGHIEAIDSVLPPPPESAVMIDGRGAYLSRGFCDVGALCGEPGEEVVEDLQSLSHVALAGGYTHVALTSNTVQPYDNRHLIVDMQNSSRFGVHFIALPTLNKQSNPSELTEMLEIAEVTSPIFHPLPNHPMDVQILGRALEYANQCQGRVMASVAYTFQNGGGQVHESGTSAMMGLPGIPAIDEHMNIELLSQMATYSNGSLLLHLLSSAESVQQLKQIKNRDSRHLASVSAMHLLNNEEDVRSFDENFKVLPPLRSEHDRLALIDGLRTGVIDMIVSNHHPHSPERKERAFGQSPFGSIGLQTALGQVIEAIPDVTPEKIGYWMSDAARKMLGLPCTSIELHNKADLTLYHMDSQYHFTQEDSYSKSRNSSYFGKTFQGGVIATIHDHQIFIKT